MTRINIHDAYHDVPRTRRDVLVERIRQLKAQGWSDPGDADLKELLEKAEAELAALDARGAAR
jgi:hypothetical protein